MICGNCNKKIMSNSKYCCSCGAEIKKEIRVHGDDKIEGNKVIKANGNLKYIIALCVVMIIGFISAKTMSPEKLSMDSYASRWDICQNTIDEKEEAFDDGVYDAYVYNDSISIEFLKEYSNLYKDIKEIYEEFGAKDKVLQSQHEILIETAGNMEKECKNIYKELKSKDMDFISEDYLTNDYTFNYLNKYYESLYSTTQDIEDILRYETE